MPTPTAPPPYSAPTSVSSSPIQASPVVTDLLIALVSFRRDLPRVPKQAVNPHFGSRYADLPSIMDVVDPLLDKHGLLLMQWMADGGPDRAALAVRLYHIPTGQYLECVAACGVARDDAQSAGGANTYLRRYALCALGVITETDDDGNAASGPRTQPQRQERQPQGRTYGTRAPAQPVRNGKGAQYDDDL